MIKCDSCGEKAKVTKCSPCKNCGVRVCQTGNSNKILQARRHARLMQQRSMIRNGRLQKK